MDQLKQQIRQRLVANIIIEKCSQSEYLIFRDAWCTQERVLRFTTPFFRKFFSVTEDESGLWKTGDCVMYEVNNSPDSFTVNCVFCPSSVSMAALEQKKDLLKAVNAEPDADVIILKSWDLTRADGDDNKLFDDFDRLITKDVPKFEINLKGKIESAKNSEDLTEGAQTQVKLNKYERNQKARAACLAAHGTACSVCGIDFGKAYGPAFAGQIEVHHIIPLSEIGEEYVVDPINDLIPVCPNCHTALHSKKDGVYTVDELKAMRLKNE